MSCHYILAPAMVDTSNLSSLHGLLTAVLPTWFREHKQLRRLNTLDALKATAPGREDDLEIFRLPRNLPKLLPVLAVNFAVRRASGDVTRVMRGKSQWINQMRTLFADVIQQSQEPLPQGSTYSRQLHHEGLKQVCSFTEHLHSHHNVFAKCSHSCLTCCLRYEGVLQCCPSRSMM